MRILLFLNSLHKRFATSGFLQSQRNGNHSSSKSKQTPLSGKPLPVWGIKVKHGKSVLLLLLINLPTTKRKIRSRRELSIDQDIDSVTFEYNHITRFPCLAENPNHTPKIPIGLPKERREMLFLLKEKYGILVILTCFQRKI